MSERWPPRPVLGKDADARLGAHLSKAGELLRSGQLDEAHAEVAAALRLRPDDVRAQNLLGLLHFRTGKLEEARAIYQRLLGLHAGDVALRLNLGLVELRRADYAAAIAHLGRVAEVEPDNIRALGYYGLALFRAGELERALPILQRAGQTDLVREAEQELSRRRPPEPEELDLAPDEEPDDAEDTEPHDASFLAEDDETPAPMPPRVAQPLPPSADSPTEVGLGAPLSLGAFLRARVLGQRPSGTAFELTDEGLLVVRVDPEESDARGESGLRLCTTGALACSGTLRFRPLPRITAGLPMESFGEGDDGLQIASGTGVVVLSPSGGRFVLLSLRGEALRLREGCLFGFSASLRYECGVMPCAPGSTAGPPPAPEERAVVTLRGEGELVLRAAGAPYALRVVPGQRCFVDLARLVGWTASVRPLVHVAPGPGGGAYVECRGDGHVLLEPTREPDKA